MLAVISRDAAITVEELNTLPLTGVCVVYSPPPTGERSLCE